MVHLCTQILPNNASTLWFKRATIRYDDYYVRLYVSFNAWYQHIAHSTNDRVAINYLKTRPEIWQRYYAGRQFSSLTPYLIQLTELTQREPIETKKAYWDGSVHSSLDWSSLLEFWYHIRCVTVHGDEAGQEYLFLAYHTLYLFLEKALAVPYWLGRVTHNSNEEATAINPSLLSSKKTV